MDTHLFKTLGQELTAQKLSIATAESCTGGLIAHQITDISGASRYFLGGLIAYSNRIKEDLLGVSRALLLEHGAVSEATAKAMVEGALRLFNTDCAIAVTGIAGPDGGSAEKPVGLVYIALAKHGETWVSREQFSGSRSAIKEQTAEKAVALLLAQL